MANIKDLKVRIKSTKSTLKITSAMKLVSAAKLAKAQGRIANFKPYSSELESTVRMASSLVENYTHEYLEENKEAKKSVILIVSSEKGLCGGYNAQLFKKVKKFTESTGENFDYYFIGRKVQALLKREGISSTKKYEFSKNEPTFDEVKAIANELAQMFVKDEAAKVYLAFNSFVSAIEFNSQVKQLLPMTAVEDEGSVQAKVQTTTDFIYEPSAAKILDSLIPEVLNTTIFTSLLDAVAAEHGSRMTAMDNATNNSKDMIKNLTLTANKLRQAAITTELTEIVSGAESLNS
jgi:F-type H+-transporting ATPase subunit gamma